MNTKKLSKLLLATTLMFGLTGVMMSAQAATSATQTLQATLGSFVDITPDNTAVLSATIDTTTGNLSNTLVSKFDIELNGATTLYLRANADSSTTTEQAFFENGSDVFVVLTNTVNKPTVAAITDAKSATPDALNNANVMAYNVTGVVLTGATTAAPTFNSTSSQYEIAGEAGVSNAATTIATTVVPTTYSYLDTAGTYQAIVTLSSSPT